MPQLLGGMLGHKVARLKKKGSCASYGSIIDSPAEHKSRSSNIVHDFSMKIRHQILIIWIDNAPSSASSIFNIPTPVPSETPRLLLQRPPTLDIVLTSLP